MRNSSSTGVKSDGVKAAELRSRLAALVESSNDAIIAVTLDGTVTGWNPGAERLYGFTAGKALGRHISLIVPPEQCGESAALLALVLSEKRVEHFETVRLRKDRVPVDVSMTLSPVRNARGQIVGASAIARDITEAKRAAAENSRLATAVEQAAEALLITDQEGIIEYANPAFTRISGYGLEEVRGQTPRVLKSGRHDPTFYQSLWATICEGEVWRGEIVNRRKDGTFYDEATTIAPVRSAAGKITHFIAVKQDISERKRAEEEIRQLTANLEGRVAERTLQLENSNRSLEREIADRKRVQAALNQAEEQLRRMLGSIRDYAIFMLDRDGRVLSWSAGAESIVGYTADEIIGRPFLRFSSPEDVAEGKPQQELQHAAEEGHREEEGWRVRKNGTRFWAHVAVAPIRDSTGNLLGYSKVMRDLTERKRIEEMLREEQTRFKRLFECSPDALFAVEVDGRIALANPCAEVAFGYPREELAGKPIEMLLPARFHARLAEHRRAYRSTTDRRPMGMGRDVFARRKDGSEFPADVTLSPLGNTEAVLAVVRDTTDLRKVEKMKDQFVSIVSHELRTPLTSIRGALGLLSAAEGTPDTPEKRRLLEIAASNTDRLARLVNDVLDGERLGEENLPRHTLRTTASELVLQAIDLMRVSAEAAGVTLEAKTEPVVVEVDTDAILQVLTNLLSNAVKFSPPGAQVRIEVQKTGAMATFRVIDHGKGIPPDKLESIFGRFQPVDASDSRRRGGTGLGLSICRRIVTQHGGRIWAESELGLGSVFVFTVGVGEEGGGR